jgi:hypothetical protein
LKAPAKDLASREIHTVWRVQSLTDNRISRYSFIGTYGEAAVRHLPYAPVWSQPIILDSLARCFSSFSCPFSKARKRSLFAS